MSRNTPELIPMMRALVEAPSISCMQPALDMSNEPVIDLLANWLDIAGFHVDKQFVSAGKYNLIATLGHGSDGLILAGHTDTVPCNEALWKSDPFKLVERDNKLYGLGSCDMKTFHALAIHASQSFTQQQLKRPLTIIATADEETTMSGARKLTRDNLPLGRYCIIGEPTGLAPVREHKGILMESIRFVGASGHSSNPALGNSALEAMHIFIQRLLELRDSLQQQFRNPAFDVPGPTLNLGHIHGGDNPNRICGDCELHIDLRFLPGMQLNDLRQRIHDLAQTVADERALAAHSESLFMGTPAMQTDDDSELNRYLETMTNQQSQSVAFGTEGPYYNAIGCETIVIGPGFIEQAHQPDEFLATAQIVPTIKMLENLIQRFCCQ